MTPRIVVIGGGTGSYTVLQGLKHHTDRLTAVVSVADDGGSSGRLRDEFGHLPPGDLRQCLLALSPSDEIGEVLRRLLDYRFDRGEGLNGHSFGNLLLTALTEVTGSTEGAIREASRLLNIRGRVLPVALENTRLVAELEDGTLIRGEANIDVRTVKPDVPIRHIYLDPDATVHGETQEAILEADVIVIGPGDLYTSVLPNLLVRGVPEAIHESPGIKVYVCNLMTKHGETAGFKASDFLSEVLRYLGHGGAIDYFLLDDVEYEPDLLERYAQEQSYPVAADVARCQELAGAVVSAPLSCCGTLLRHDPELLAGRIIGITELGTSKPPAPSISAPLDR
jgi:uncharacterized cofD-like protein